MRNCVQFDAVPGRFEAIGVHFRAVHVPFGGDLGRFWAVRYGHFTTGGIEERIEVTLPPVFRPKVVPRSKSRLNST